jgi:hypothetical protein
MATGTEGSCNSKEDPAWVYVIRDDKDKNKTTCKFCSKVMNGGIYRAKQHFEDDFEHDPSTTPDEIQIF